MTERELEERLGRLEAQQEAIDEWLREMLRGMKNTDEKFAGLEAAVERLEGAIQELIDGMKSSER